jgi:hypothetical protein
MHTLSPMVAVERVSPIAIENFHKNNKGLPPHRSFLPSGLSLTLLYSRSIEKKVQL